MSLTENSNQVFLPGGATELKFEIWPLDHFIFLDIRYIDNLN